MCGVWENNDKQDQTKSDPGINMMYGTTKTVVSISQHNISSQDDNEDDDEDEDGDDNNKSNDVCMKQFRSKQRRRR